MARPSHDDDPRERESKRRRYSSDHDSPRPRRRQHHDDDSSRALTRPSTRDHDRRPTSDRRRRHSPASDNSSDHDDRRRRERRHRRRDSPSPPPRRPRSRSGPLPSQSASFALTTGDEPPVEKQKPNFAPTGLLAKEANTVSTSRAGRAVVLKYHEPPEARKPPATQPWRLFRFGSAAEPKDTLELGDRSCWLFGREASVVDVLLDEPTASKQHAVVQFRYSMARNDYGDKIERVRPYVIDLESKAGTSLNGSKLEAGRYVELRDGDVLVFGAPDKDGEAEEWVVMLPPAE